MGSYFSYDQIKYILMIKLNCYSLLAPSFFVSSVDLTIKTGYRIALLIALLTAVQEDHRLNHARYLDL